ncbi:TIGR02611 family protein [Kineococcus gypseus]|uniref:TIGR02611 family protein n=1 Tax=Kineococcus gypseus TaxID=1637102 RepID=UPI003D7D4BE9
MRVTASSQDGRGGTGGRAPASGGSAPARPSDPPRPAGLPDPPPGPGVPAPAAAVPAPRRHRVERLRAALRARRERLRADAHADRAYRTAVGVVGTGVVLLGLALVPLPGPGWLVVFLGLAVLGTEFATARRLHRFARRQVHRWSTWLARRSWRTRVALGSGTAAAVGALAWGYLAWQGVPAWSPEVVTAQLTRLPGL